MDICITGLTRTFGKVTALHGVDLEIRTGMFGLLGPNGAGKTTLMRILAGVITPSSGQVSVGRHDMTTPPGRRRVQRRLGYLPQDVGVYPDLTAAEFLDYVALLKGLDSTRYRQSQIAQLLDLVGLAEVANRKLGGFSGGMRRRVGIAQALLGNPTLIVVDEPTAGLDPEERVRFRTLLAGVATGAGRTVLLSTHIVEDIAQTCLDAAVLAAGRIVYTGPVSGITAHGRGLTWEVVSQSSPPGAGLVVSAVTGAEGTRYRVISPTPPAPAARPVEPSLEDGYVALMRRAQNLPRPARRTPRTA